jgi:capsid protein
MARPHPITVKPGTKAGELIVNLPSGWELRLRRVLRYILAEPLSDSHDKGLTPAQRQARARARRRRRQTAMCQYLSDLVTAEIVGKEVALSTRGRYGSRRGSLREHVEAILRDVAGE